MAVITISRHFGAGGRTLGRRVANRLGYRYVDEDIIRQIALKAKVSRAQVRSFEKDGTTKLMKFLDKIISTDYIHRLTEDKYRYIDESMYLDAVREVIRDFYEKDNAVIIGRGGQFILQGYDHAYHILLVADMETKIRFLGKHYRLGEPDAKKAVERANDIRKRFLTIFAPPEMHDNPLVYHLAINMSRVTLEVAEELVVRLVKEGKS